MYSVWCEKVPTLFLPCNVLQHLDNSIDKSYFLAKLSNLPLEWSIVYIFPAATSVYNYYYIESDIKDKS